MAEHHEYEEAKGDSLLDKISGKIHDHHDSSSSSDSDNEKSSTSDSLKSKVFRLFGREKSIHHVLGGGKRMRLFPSSFLFLFLFYSFLVSLFLLPFLALDVVIEVYCGPGVYEVPLSSWSF